jgi:glucose/arabinose dehydrogenase
VLLLGLTVFSSSPATAQAVQPKTIIEGLDFVSGIAFSSDGRSMYVNERAGRVRLIDEDGLRDDPLTTIPTTTAGETGLLGIAVSPDGADLFVFATDPGGSSNRVLRLPSEGGDAEVVVEGLPASLYHNGGGLAFDRDGLLLVSNGEIHDSGAAQDPEVLGGKVYRYTPEGEVADNPFGESVAVGLRNPFGMTLDPVTGDAFVTDNGPSSHDEVNRIEAGGNYGWPDVLGVAGDARPPGPGVYHDPVTVQEEIVVPTGIAIADPENARREFSGDLFYGTYGEQTIHRVELDEERATAVSDEVFLRETEPVIALEWGPRGLYYSTPTAIKVIELADGGGNGRTAGGEESPGDPGFIPSMPPDRGGPPMVVVLLAIAAVIVGAIVMFVARR